jgi:hypothetical protein
MHWSASKPQEVISVGCERPIRAALDFHQKENMGLASTDFNKLVPKVDDGFP